MCMCERKAANHKSSKSLESNFVWCVGVILRFLLQFKKLMCVYSSVIKRMDRQATSEREKYSKRMKKEETESERGRAFCVR